MNKGTRPLAAIRLALFLGLLCAFTGPEAWADPGRVECDSLSSKILAQSVRYCILLPPSFDRERTKRFPILYSLHGLGDNEQYLVRYGLWNLVEDLREQGDLKEFLVATPDAGTSFYINSKDGRNRYEDFLITEFFPYIERRYRVASGHAYRAVSGESMGGYGALHLAFHHPQLFSSVSALSPALVERLPIVVGSTTGFRSANVLRAFGTPPDPAFWERNSPLSLARSADLAGLRILFNCGAEDDYGFEAGAAALDKVLSSRHIVHDYHLYPGRHDAAYFAAHLPAALEFHSRGFPP